MADPTNMSFYPQTSRMDQLGQLSSQVNQGITQQAQGQQAQRVTGLQNAVQQAAGAGARPTAGAIQQMGAQQTEQAGQIAGGAAQMAQTRQAQVGAMGLQEQFMSDQQKLATQKQSLLTTNQQLQNQLAQLNQKVKAELIDKQTQFAKDAMGRTLFNDRQMMDLAVYKAKSANDLASYEQSVQEQTQKRLAMLTQAHAVITDAMQNGAAAWNQAMDDKLKQQLAQQQQAIELKIKQAQARANANAGMFSAAGEIVGGIVGAVVGGAPGAVAGASLGGGVGRIAYSQTEGQQDQQNIQQAGQQ